VPPHARLNLLVNYEETLSGELVEIIPGQGVYRLEDNGQELSLSGVRYGNNRVQWRMVTEDGYTISSSTYNKPGMEDFTFYLEEPQNIRPTVIDFPVELQAYYDVPGSERELPAMTIRRDPGTTAAVYLNNKLIWNQQASSGTVIDGTVTDAVNILQGQPQEGPNEVEVTYSEGGGSPITKSYNFLFDSKPPEVKIIQYEYEPGFAGLASLTALVTEANLSRVTLYQGSGTLTKIQITPVISYVENDIYKVTWSGLENYNLPQGIVPSAGQPLQVEVYDRAHPDAVYAVFPGVGADVVRPQEDLIEAFPITLPQFNQNPFYVDEDGYAYVEHPEFDTHTKFFNSRLTLRDLTVEQGQTLKFERHETITAGGSVLVQGNGTSGGTLILRAGEESSPGVVTLKPGFAVENGGSLIIENHDLGLAPPTDGSFQHRSRPWR
jgi:hypothetical protein